MADDEEDGVPRPVCLPDGSTLEARPVDGGAGVELSVEGGGRVLRFPVERTRRPDDD